MRLLLALAILVAALTAAQGARDHSLRSRILQAQAAGESSWKLTQEEVDAVVGVWDVKVSPEGGNSSARGRRGSAGRCRSCTSRSWGPDR